MPELDIICPQCGTPTEVVLVQGEDGAVRCQHCGTSLPGAGASMETPDREDDVSMLLQQMGFKDPFNARGAQRPSAPAHTQQKESKDVDTGWTFRSTSKTDLSAMSPELARFAAQHRNAPPMPEPLPRRPLKKSFWRRIFGREK